MTLADEKIFEEAMTLRNGKHHKKALNIFHFLEDRYPRFSPLYGMIATCYYETKDYIKSVKYFKKTVRLNPKSELASLGLFQSFLFTGKTKNAFLEMDRYLTENEAELYKVTISEMNEHIQSYSKPYQQEIIKKYTNA